MEDYKIINSILSGKQDMYRFLIRKYGDSAWRMAYKILKNNMLCEDAVQNAYILSFKNLEKFRHESSFKTWLLTIVYRESLKIADKEKKKHFIDIENLALESIENTYFDIEIKKENLKKIKESLQELNPKYALALNLFYFEELSIKEISEITNWEENNTKVILYRARKEFKDIFDKKCKLASS